MSQSGEDLLPQKSFSFSRADAYRGSRSIDPLILNLPFTLRALYLWERNAGLIKQEAGCAPEPVWAFSENKKQALITG
jgi:hypothetical protein